MSDFQDEFNFKKGKKYPDHPGFKNTDTSEDAADKIVSKAATMRGQISEMLEEEGWDGVASDEAADKYGFIVVSTRPRFSELRAKGEIIDSGRRRKSAYGAKQIVWIKPKFKKGDK